MTPSLEVDRQARRALTRQTSGAIASTLTRGNRLITPNIAEGISGLSQREMRRRAEQGRFPEPVKIGEGKNGRIASPDTVASSSMNTPKSTAVIPVPPPRASGCSVLLLLQDAFARSFV